MRCVLSVLLAGQSYRRLLADIQLSASDWEAASRAEYRLVSRIVIATMSKMAITDERQDNRRTTLRGRSI
jgi:hypothetical protein